MSQRGHSLSKTIVAEVKTPSDKAKYPGCRAAFDTREKPIDHDAETTRIAKYARPKLKQEKN